MSSDRSVLKRNTATLSQLMAVGAMSVLSCDQSIPVAEPQIEQQKQAIVSSQEAPSTSLPAAAPPVRPSTSTIQKSVGGTAPAAPKVMYRGCRVVQKTPDRLLCLQSATSRTVLWVENTPCEQLEVRDNNQPVAVDASYVEGGCQLKQKEPSKPPRSTLSIHNKDTGTSFWSLQTDRSKPWLMEWTDRIEARSTQDLLGSPDELLSLSLSGHQADALVMLDLRFARGRALYRLGEYRQALQEFRGIQESASQLGLYTIAFRAGRNCIELLLLLGEPADAKLIFDDISQFLTPGLGWDYIAQARDGGAIARDLGQYSVALSWYQQSQSYAERMNDQAILSVVLPDLAVLLHKLNRQDDLRRLLPRVSDLLEKLPPEKQISLLLVLGVIHIREAQISKLPADSLAKAEAFLRRSQAINRDSLWSNHSTESDLALAQVAMLQGKLTESEQILTRLRSATGLTHESQLQFYDLEAQLAIRGQQPTVAEKSLSTLETLARQRPGLASQLYLCRSAVHRLSIHSEQPELRRYASWCLSSEANLDPIERSELSERLSSARAVP
jgi:tetratricopeptide (TPR) repeat protein